MKLRLADYVADFLLQHGVTDCFAVTGGGAMCLNDAIGHKQGLHCLYHHHEQACAMAAEAYARVHNQIAAVCVTSGPGGTNALTGVLGAFLDSVPMLVLSGQVRYDTTARSTGLPLRALGDQEFDITGAVSGMTKYAVMLERPCDIRYVLEKALHLATTGRKGPCWVDIPVNFQSAMIDTDELIPFDGVAEAAPPVSEKTVEAVLQKLLAAKRPVIYAGNGIRLSGGFSVFERLVSRLNVPVVTAWNAIDAMQSEDPLYVGRGGMMGDRAGNFAVQNADLVLSLGCRLSIRQVGYNYATWAKNAFVIMVDVDEAELKKPTLHVEMPVHADVQDFLEKLEACLPQSPLYPDNGWQKQCLFWKKTYPVVQQKQKNARGLVNPYAFIETLSDALPEGAFTVSGNGSACVMGSQAFVIRKGQRFLVNSGAASMGYDLPAAIGTCVALEKEQVICLTGDGSIQMNLQELQTILTNRLPVKIFLLNNGGYHSIRQTQSNHFAQHTKVGVGPESKDLSFPLMEKLAAAYGYPYYACRDNTAREEFVQTVLAQDGACIAEVFVDPSQLFEPKSSAKKGEDGSLCSPPLEDMAPFLAREELEAVMSVSKKKNL